MKTTVDSRSRRRGGVASLSRAWHVFVKTGRETRRDLLVVSLTVAFAPFFVLIFYFAFGATSPVYKVALVDQDLAVVRPDGTALRAGTDVTAALIESRDPSGHPLLEVQAVASELEAVRLLERGEVEVAVVLDPSFSGSVAALLDQSDPATRVPLTVVGDPTRPKYGIAVGLCYSIVDSYLGDLTGRGSPLLLAERPLGNSAVRSDFEMAVPGIMVFAVIMLVFQAAMLVAREAESGAIRRLRMTRMTPFEFLAGTSGVLILLGLLAVLAAYGTAAALGFESAGPLWAAVVVSVVMAVAVIGVGLMIAAVTRSVVKAFLVANFPFAFLAFFSGSMFPLPDMALFQVAGHDIGPLDVLPSFHAVNALNKIVSMGAGLSEATYELSALVGLSALYFTIGVVLLQRSQLRATRAA